MRNEFCNVHKKNFKFEFIFNIYVFCFLFFFFFFKRWSSYRNEDHLKFNLPEIPAQVIGYGLACKILNSFEIDANVDVPIDWKGQLANCSYKYGGPLINNKFENWKSIILQNKVSSFAVLKIRSLTMAVYNKPRIAKTYNVVGVIRGSTEPGFIILSNVSLRSILI